MSVIRPQEGFQTAFLSSSADIVIGGSGAGCFTGETLVKTLSGYSEIKDVKIGDYVASFNVKTNIVEHKLVCQTLVHESVTSNRKMIIFEFNNGVELKCTDNHEFLFEGNWVESKVIAGRKMGLHSEDYESIFDFYKRKNNNNELEEQRNSKGYDSRIRYQRLLQNSYKIREKRRFKITDCKNTPFSLRNVFTKNRREKYSKPYRQKSSKQLFRESRMVHSKRKLSSFYKRDGGFYKKLRKHKELKTLEGVRYRNFCFNRKDCFRDKRETCAQNKNSENAIKGIRCFGNHNKKGFEQKFLGAREIKLDDISKIYIEDVCETVYDLSVVDNNNYLVTKDNLIVHNCGKTFSLLLEPLRNIHVKNFGAVFFRRTTPQIKAEGGLWDASTKIYNLISSANPRQSVLEWDFDNNVKIKFSHLEHEKNIHDWQGSEIPFIAFDELTHFTEKMFFYLLTRNRSTCGVQPYIRATCNPDPESWVANFISWWIDKDGLPIPEREGKLRYFLKDGDSYIWGDSKEEVKNKASYIINPILEASKGTVNPNDLIKSLTFISGSIYDNKELLKVDPNYLGNLLAQDETTKEQLLNGNWKVKLSDNDLIDFYKLQDSFYNNGLPKGKKCITADIAMQGSDKLVIGYWEGWRLEDIKIIDKSNGAEVLAAINEFRVNYRVPNSSIIYDNDGVGAGISGFIKGAIPFHNGAKAMKEPEYGNKKQPVNYRNLKTQCYYRLGNVFSNDNIFISKKVLETKYNETTVIERLKSERAAIKKGKSTNDGKLTLISKDEMKAKGDGSPDIFDMIMMRVLLDLYIKQRPIKIIGR